MLRIMLYGDEGITEEGGWGIACGLTMSLATSVAKMTTNEKNQPPSVGGISA